MGNLVAMVERRTEVFNFEYDLDWLRSSPGQVLDPELRYFAGDQYPAAARSNFGVFLDSSPDRWGRLLMDRREAQAAREEGRLRANLRESDYLLGVFDGQRMGGLRFRLDPPRWSQGVEYPPCRQCGKTMEMVLQVNNDGNSDSRPGFNSCFGQLFAGDGNGHVCRCPDHHEVMTFNWACG